MAQQHQNLHSIPIDMVICILKKILLVGNFEDFYNLFIIWSQTQRPAVIASFLHAYPIEELYKFSNSRYEPDIVCFYRFLRTVLNIPATTCYMPCKNMICGVGHINAQMDVLQSLSNGGHLLSKLALIIFQAFIRPDIGLGEATTLAEMCNYPHYRRQIIPALKHLQDIQAYNTIDPLLQRQNMHTRCIVHTGHTTCGKNKKKTSISSRDNTQILEECMQCNVAYILSVFSNLY